MIKINLKNNFFVFEKESDFQSMNSKNYGKKRDTMYILNNYEALYLLEKGRISIFKGNKEISFEELFKKRLVKKEDYLVYKDLKNRAYNVQSGLKYGFAFRVYDKKESHALWLVEPTNELGSFKIKDFTGKNRVAHSTRKKMMFAVVDSDSDITYLEIDWKRM